MSEPKIRLFDFSIGTKKSECIIEMFGMDKSGKTYCVLVEGFKPFFYVKVPDNWNNSDLIGFLNHIESQINETNPNSSSSDDDDDFNTQISDDIIRADCKLVKKKKLYVSLVDIFSLVMKIKTI